MTPPPGTTVNVANAIVAESDMHAHGAAGIE